MARRHSDKAVSDEDLQRELLATQSAPKAARALGLNRRTLYRRAGDLASLDRPICWLPQAAAQAVDAMGEEELRQLADLIVEKFPG